MNSFDREFVNTIIEASDEEFQAMMDIMTDDELNEVLRLVQIARTEMLEAELDEIDAQVCEEDFVDDAKNVLGKFTK
jgi:hypothetical protein